MPGSAGSKYGIIDDEIPVKKNCTAVDINSGKELDDRLRDIRALIRIRANKKQIGKAKSQ